MTMAVVVAITRAGRRVGLFRQPAGSAVCCRSKVSFAATVSLRGFGVLDLFFRQNREKVPDEQRTGTAQEILQQPLLLRYVAIVAHLPVFARLVNHDEARKRSVLTRCKLIALQQLVQRTI